MNEPIQMLRDLLAAGMSQADISRESGIHKSRISRWLDGQVPAGARDVILLQGLVKKVARRKKRATA